MEYVEQFWGGREGEISHSSEFIAVLKPTADAFEFLRNLNDFFIFVFDVVVELGLDLKQALEILVDADFDEGLLEQGSFDALLILIVEVVTDELGKFRAVSLKVFIVVNIFLHFKLFIVIVQHF